MLAVAVEDLVACLPSQRDCTVSGGTGRGLARRDASLRGREMDGVRKDSSSNNFTAGQNRGRDCANAGESTCRVGDDKSITCVITEEVSCPYI